MTGLTTDILLMLLKSNLEIEEEVYRATRRFYQSNSFEVAVCEAKIKEIKRQIFIIESANTKQQP